MTAVRKVIDSSALANIFDLPPSLKNKRVEVVLLPVDESISEISTDKSSVPMKKNFPLLTIAQIEEWAKAPEIQALVGVLKGAGLSADININDIRNERVAEKYKI